MDIEGDNLGRCLACDSSCKTCSLTSNNCITCLNNTYELTLTNKCLRKDKILIVAKLDISLETYATTATKVREGLAALLGANHQNRTELILLKSIRRGSTIIDALLAVPDN